MVSINFNFADARRCNCCDSQQAEPVQISHIATFMAHAISAFDRPGARMGRDEAAYSVRAQLGPPHFEVSV